MPTKLLYLEDMNKLNSPAQVVELLTENAREVIVLDQTIFYPQGGGQPFDQGVIENNGNKFLVEEVRFIDGIVKHIGQYENGRFVVGDNVVCEVNEPRRNLHSRLHSAGHVVDMAVLALGLNWIPGKGYHFPDGPYIEYAGNLDGTDKDLLKNQIETECQKLIVENRPTSLKFMPKEEMAAVCPHVPEFLPAGKPGRVVFYGSFGVPCGGTHVKQLGDIIKITIRKIKMDGTNIRVAYDVKNT